MWLAMLWVILQANPPIGACINTHLQWSPDSQNVLFYGHSKDASQVYLWQSGSQNLQALPQGNDAWFFGTDGQPKQIKGIGQFAVPSPIIDYPFRVFFLLLGGLLAGLVAHRRGNYILLLAAGTLICLSLFVSALRQSSARPPWLLFAKKNNYQLAEVRAGLRLPQTPQVIHTAFSADGRYIAYLYWEGLALFAVQHLQNLYVYKENISQFAWRQHQIITLNKNKVHLHEDFSAATPPRLIGEGSNFALSPDGEWLALIQGKQLNLIQLDGTGLQTLLSVTFDERFGSLAWSPNGEWIAFELIGRSDLGRFAASPTRTGFEFINWSEIYRIHPDGSGLQKLVAADQSLCPLKIGYLSEN